MSKLIWYKDNSLKLLTDAGIQIGDFIKIDTKTTKYSGNLLPRYEYSNVNYIVIKLSNGYNIGIDSKKITNIIKVKSGEEP